MKQLYEQFVLDAGDSEVALRHVKQVYFQIQKHRINSRIQEMMEFHPFFGINTLSNHFDEQEDDEDDLI